MLTHSSCTFQYPNFVITKEAKFTQVPGSGIPTQPRERTSSSAGFFCVLAHKTISIIMEDNSDPRYPF